MPTRKGSRRKYGAAASRSVESAMRREKRGTLRSGKGGKGGKVTSRKQAIAIRPGSAQEGREGFLENDPANSVPPVSGGWQVRRS